MFQTWLDFGAFPYYLTYNHSHDQPDQSVPAPTTRPNNKPDSWELPLSPAPPRFFITLDTGCRRPVCLELGDTTVYRGTSLIRNRAPL